MSTLVIAKKEFEDSVRSRALILMATLFTVFLAFLVYYHLYLSSGARLEEIRRSAPIVNKIVSQAAILIPVLGTLLGYKAVVGERESGSLKLLLSFPHSRREVILGKFLGRAATVVVTVLIGFAVVGVQFAVVSNLFSLTAYVLAAGKIVILGVVFVAIAIAFSTAMRSSMMATWGAIGLATVFVFLWDSVMVLLDAIVRPPPTQVSGGVIIEPSPDWFYLIKRLNPRHAFKSATELGMTSEPTPFYLDPWFGGVILGVWLIVPLALASLRFQRSDLA